MQNQAPIGLQAVMTTKHDSYTASIAVHHVHANIGMQVVFIQHVMAP